LANNVTRHIDEVLVEDVRHVFEDFSIKFLYARNKWYIKDKLKLLQSGKFSLKEKLSLLSSMLFYIAFLPIVLFTILGISAFFVINSFYAYMSFSLLLICYIAFFTFISWHKRIRLTKEVLLAITMLPLFLVVNSMLVYISLINIVKEKL
ncbi:MAG: hypothetical protein QXV57_09005, partial [Thermoproteota archaeon]